MKTFLFPIFFLMSAICFSQKNAAFDLADYPQIKYIQVVTLLEGKGADMKLVSYVDAGFAPPGNVHAYVLDESGNHRRWLTAIEMMNYFAGFGWDFVYEKPAGVATWTSYVFKRR